MTLAEAHQAEILPDVTEQDIRDVERRWGVTFDEPRCQILRSNESFDVEACPGSGKTTLLVAKLAILAGKWPHAHRGICVLSHTNVARQEVEKRLVGTAAGQRLLGPPHFVGTIHGFVNQFLALPLMRSEGTAFRLIDDDVCGKYCRWLLHHNRSYSTAKNFLSKWEGHSPDRTILALRYEGAAFDLRSAAGNMPCGPETPSHRQCSDIKVRASRKGLWRHDDMFAWACKLLQLHPSAGRYARWRFPAVFIDEMQDTSEMQNDVLSQLFPLGECILRQRFGDPNQAIYDFGQKSAATDPFPDGGPWKLPNSKRFGPEIAAKAKPLAPIPPDPELIGEGPQLRHGADTESDTVAHTIFCFDADSIGQVLPAFGKLLLDTLPVSILQSDVFVARAIGRIGKPKGEERTIACSIPDYWESYESRSAKLKPTPDTLSDFLHLAQRLRNRKGDCFESVRAAARGIVELIRRVDLVDTSRTTQSMKWIREAMAAEPSALRDLHRHLWRWCVEMAPLCEEDWPEHAISLRQILGSLIGDSWPRNADEFCRWSVEFAGNGDGGGRDPARKPNRYEYGDGDCGVKIEVGTIHGAKGQTHTATLVLETRYKKHDLADLLPWISGYGNKPNKGKEREERMRLIYTAMTRPTHLLCLAIRREALGSEEEREEHLNGLRKRGWKVKDL